MKVLLLGVLFLAIGTIDASPRTQLDELIARAKSLELDTPYVPPPYELRAKLGKPVIDRADKAVHITLPNGVTRTAKYLGSQGCVTFPLGESAVHFRPVVAKSQLTGTEPWPMGDVLAEGPCRPRSTR